MDYPQTDRNKVHRIPERGKYDESTIHAILDSGYLCHIGFVVEEQPFVIPTLYGREEESVYLHGAPASRMLKNLSQGIDVCMSVTHLDGLVLARSAFHHSMNYRSVVLFGTATELHGEEKERGLYVISEHIVKGRWQEARPPNDKELRSTSVLRLAITSASAKIRTGPPKDEEEDYSLPIWAGVIPLQQAFGTTETESRVPENIGLPPSVVSLLKGRVEMIQK